MTYKKQLLDPRWTARSRRMKEKAEWRCQDCFIHAKDCGHLETHHCYYVSWMKLWDYPDELLIVVCPDCHKFRQQREQQAHIDFAKAMRSFRPSQLDDAVWLFLAQVYLKPWESAA